MRSIRITTFLSLVLAPALFAQGSSSAAKAAATITAAEVKAHVAFLASDSLGGRDTPSPGLEKAAAYIANQFKEYGLKPAGDSGTYIQRWPYQAQKLTASKLVTELHGQDSHVSLEFGKDYFVLASPNVSSLAGEIAFAGSAATAQPSQAYTGKIIAFYSAGGDLTEWGKNAQAGAIAAITSGAQGIVFILDPEFDASDVADAAANLSGQALPIPTIAIRNEVARAWLRGTPIDLAQASVAAPIPASGTTINMTAALEGNTARVPNVVAILEGSDPQLKDSYVVYSAHMDHVGIGRPNAKGDSIYNGADDDASGTTAVMEIAEAFASLSARPKRSVIFLLVSGEEKGLFGSRYFVENPPVPVEKMVANINLDMIGRNARDSTVAIGQEYSSLGTITQAVVKAHPELKLVVAPDLWPQEKLFFRSDHFSFAAKKIPAIFFTSGLHADYHKPSDEPETIDNDKLMRTARLVFWLGYDVANRADAPAWTEEGLRAVAQAAGQH